QVHCCEHANRIPARWCPVVPVKAGAVVIGQGIRNRDQTRANESLWQKLRPLIVVRKQEIYAALGIDIDDRQIRVAIHANLQHQAVARCTSVSRIPNSYDSARWLDRLLSSRGRVGHDVDRYLNTRRRVFEAEE